MEKKRLLLILQEIDPYTAFSQISQIARQIPQYMHNSGMELRILMPRFGVINERRHRLHEVVRLSGMNIVVNDEDFPLIIKVASMPGSRLQVYFLDNDEFFKRKYLYEDDKGIAFDDNIERMIFFCKGAIETVKKFGWPPDIIHCHGWMTSMLPFYLRTLYKDEPIFRNAHITWSAYEEPGNLEYPSSDLEKALVPPMKQDTLLPFVHGDKLHFNRGAVHYSDAVIQCTDKLDPLVAEIMDAKPLLPPVDEEHMLPTYLEFYESLLAQQEA
jgi:starch synthase